MFSKHPLLVVTAKAGVRKTGAKHLQLYGLIIYSAGCHVVASRFDICVKITWFSTFKTMQWPISLLNKCKIVSFVSVLHFPQTLWSKTHLDQQKICNIIFGLKVKSPHPPIWKSTKN